MFAQQTIVLFHSMVADKVEVFTRSSIAGSPGLRWVSDGTGTYEIEEVDGVDIGTTIVLHLKSECREYADDERVKSIYYVIRMRWIIQLICLVHCSYH